LDYIIYRTIQIVSELAVAPSYKNQADFNLHSRHNDLNSLATKLEKALLLFQIKSPARTKQERSLKFESWLAFIENIATEVGSENQFAETITIHMLRKCRVLPAKKTGNCQTQVRDARLSMIRRSRAMDFTCALTTYHWPFTARVVAEVSNVPVGKNLCYGQQLMATRT
jgi:hypothetical protein